MSIPNNRHALHSHDHPKLSSSIESISPTFGPSFLPSPTSYDKGSKLETLSELTSSSRVVLNKNPNRSELPIKELSDLKLRRVTFALDKLSDDPPQQIPSRRPKRGNVVVVEDLNRAEPLRLLLGITNENKQEESKYDEKEIAIIRATQRKSLEESEKHAQEAHRAAQRIAYEVSNFKNKNARRGSLFGSSFNGAEDIDDVISHGISNLEIDKPIHLHEHHFENEITNNEDLHIKISLESIYTRCCHLREILPIPATLKQLKNKTAPLQTLKLLNPKPTLIDVYSFSDFIAIVPIKILIFDNVTMTTEMLQIILSSILNSTSIEKLSLRNVPIDSKGWKFLCKFLSRNKSISRLDISQQKIKSDLNKDQIRSEMDWNLFINTLNLRGGLEELIINGCRLSLANFTNLIENGASIKTKRLGIAQMDLSLDHLKVLTNWISSDESNQLEGLDLGFNNLNGKLKPLIKKISSAMNLQSLSINSTSLENVEDIALFIRSLSKFPNLRFLDLSNLKQIFPGVLPYLNKYLPRFASLRRLHLDYNEFSTKSISIFAEIIPKCPSLIHVSITGSSTISYSAAAALYSAVKSSSTLLNLDLDYDLIDEKINSRIAICLMRNMERSLNNDKFINQSGSKDDHVDDTHDDILFDGSLIAETAGKIIDKISSNKLKEAEDDEFTEKFLQKHFLDKIKTSREKINKTIDSLLQKRDDQHVQLSLQEKETLLRFYFLENSLAKISELFKSLDHGKFQETLQQHHQQQQKQQTPQPSSNQLNTVASANVPHQMVLEMSEGKETPIDVATGRPILLRSVSQTSMQAKKQEEEEGEFHRWGFFVQQQRHILPITTEQPVPVPPTIHEVQPQGQEQEQEKQQIQSEEVEQSKQPAFIVPKLPSGEEIREAVIKAKGIDSISSLIDSVNNETFNLNAIYPNIKENERARQSALSDEQLNNPLLHPNHDAKSLSDEECTSDNGILVVDEAYDKILNDLSRVRSNK